MARDPAEEATEIPETEARLSPAEAVAWLREVEGELFRTPSHESGREAWVVVVRVPAPLARKRPMIIGLGATAEEATRVAAAQWQTLHARETVH